MPVSPARLDAMQSEGETVPMELYKLYDIMQSIR